MPVLASAPPAAVQADATWRTSNLGALLFGAADRCVRTKMVSVRAGGFPSVSEAQLTLFHHLRPGGTRLTALAAAANLTKQSMIELVDRAEALRLVERRPDPADRRAKTVDLTDEGGRLLQALREGVGAAEREVGEAFGSFLLEVRPRLDAYAAQDQLLPPVVDDAEDGWRRHNIARMFALSARRFSREALEVARGRGWRSVSEMSLALFRTLDVEGSRLSDVAAAARMTKQSMREQVDRAEALGLVRRRPDPADGRAKTIAFTPRGLAMLGDVREGFAHAEERFRRASGRDFTDRLGERLRAFAADAACRPA